MSPKPPNKSILFKSASHHPDSFAANIVPRPVSAFARTDKAGLVIKNHTHERDQLVYAIRGVMTIQAQNSVWTIPPSYGLWIPAHVGHSVKMDTEVEMRTLYFSSGVIVDSPAECQVRAVSPLLRELIIRAMTMVPLYDEDGPDGRVMQVIIDEMRWQRTVPFSLRLPKDRRLERLCWHLMNTLGDSESIDQLGQKVGLSARSIIRLFSNGNRTNAASLAAASTANACFCSG